MAAKGFLRLALAADPVTTNSSLHARAKLVANLIVEVARLRAQEEAVFELCLPERAPTDGQQDPFPKVFHLAKSCGGGHGGRVRMPVFRGSTSAANNIVDVEDVDGDDDNEGEDENGYPGSQAIRYISALCCLH